MKPRQKDSKRSDFEEFCGIWTEADLAEFEKNTKELGKKKTAEAFGQVKFNLKRAGTPLPINDVWIAAHALETGSVVITYDTHFKSIPGLRLWQSA